MPNQLMRDQNLNFNSVHISPRRPSSMWLLALALIFSLLGETQAAAFQRRRPGAKPRSTADKTAKPAPTNTDDEWTEDPALVAESRKLEARMLQEQQQVERELLEKQNSAQTKSEDLWRGFRQTFPFHSQVVALSDAESDGSRTLIVSEPPPHIKLENILMTIGGDLLLNHRVKKQPIGYDGWVKDVVIAIKGKDEDLQAMLSRLNQRLFFTSYKSYTLKLPVSVSAKSLDLNLTITPEEIKRWVADEAEQFFPIEGGRAENLNSLAAEQSSGVYISNKRGLVGWWIPKKRNIYECRIPARQFTLDADLIIGAIANASGIFVLGRERIVPVEILPPLRFETLALLADVQDGQKGALAQSYERLRPFAGRIEEGKDWAPIYLSPQLRDTEYGSLLNITDQLLKGWSNVGQTKYVNFPYPEPSRYPFPKRLREHLDVQQALTFNWNTKGAGYTVNFGSVIVMALNRSGALPVSYIPEGTKRADPMIISAEDRGYDYFSGLSDPNLVRVVQYAALYQIFSAFDVARSAETTPSDSYPAQLLESLTNGSYAELRQASNTDLDSLAQQIVSVGSESVEEEIDKVMAKATESVNRLIGEKLRDQGIEPNSKEYNERYKSELKALKERLAQRLKRERITATKQQLEAINLNQPDADPDEQRSRRYVLSRFAALRRMPQRYAEAADQRAKGWVHTSVVVVSWNTDSQYTGGHNLDARVSKIIVSERIPLGRIDIDARGNLLVNPKDLSRVRGVARNVERNDLIGKLDIAKREHDPFKLASVQEEMQNALNRAETAAIRPRETALHLSSTPPPMKPPNKPPILTAEPGPAKGSGWGGGGKNTSLIPPIGERNSNAIRLKLGQEGRYNLEYQLAGEEKAVEIAALTHEDAMDAAVWQAMRRSKPGEPVVIEFSGIPEHKVQATLHTMEIRMGERGRAVELIGRMSGKENFASIESSLSKHYDFAKAKVETSEIRTLPTGELRQDVSLNVPAIESSGKPVSFTSEIIFNRWTPQNVISAIKTRVTRAFEGIATRWSRLAKKVGYQADVNAYNIELGRAVRKIKTRTNLDFKTKINFTVGDRQGLGDIYISQKERANGEFASGSTAGQSE